MFGWVRNFIKDKGYHLLRNALAEYEQRQELAARHAPALKVGLRKLIAEYQHGIKNGVRWNLDEVGVRVFSESDEDGKLLYIFAALGSATRRVFVDIGAGDGLQGNCANFAVNLGWTGVFIDGDSERIERGRAFYSKLQDTKNYPPRFICAMVKRENIDQLISSAGISGEVGLLSIDIDGNDYWVWDAITVISPQVVIIETHVELGMEGLVVPYDPDHVYPGRHPRYFGASPMAMARLAQGRGYRLVGSNNYGYNTIYVKNGLADELLPAVAVESVMAHPVVAAQLPLVDPVRDWEFLRV